MSDYIKEAQALIHEKLGLQKSAGLVSWLLGYDRKMKELAKPGTQEELDNQLINAYGTRENYNAFASKLPEKDAKNWIRRGEKIQFPITPPRMSTYKDNRLADPDIYGAPPKYIENPFSKKKKSK